MKRRAAFDLAIGAKAPTWFDEPQVSRTRRCIAYLLLVGSISRATADAMDGAISGCTEVPDDAQAVDGTHEATPLVAQHDGGPVPAPAPKVVHPKPTAARTLASGVDERPVTVADVRRPEARETQMGGKYDEPILRALKGELGAYGMPLSDVTRAIVGPGKPAEVKRLIGTIYSALQSLHKRGQVRKDGRMWHVARPAKPEAVSA